MYLTVTGETLPSTGCQSVRSKVAWDESHPRTQEEWHHGIRWVMCLKCFFLITDWNKNSRYLDQVPIYTSDRQIRIIVRTDESYQKLTGGCHLFSSTCQEGTKSQLNSKLPCSLVSLHHRQLPAAHRLWAGNSCFPQTMKLWRKSHKTPFYDAAWILFYTWKWGVPLRQPFREKAPVKCTSH